MPRLQRALAGVLAGLLLLAGCTSDGSSDLPTDQLAAAVRDTFGGSFAYHLEAVADRDALEDLGDRLGPLVARLNLFEIDGIVDGDVVSLDFRLYGVTSIAELRRFGDEAIFIRLGLGQEPLRSLVDAGLKARVDELAETRDLPPAVAGALRGLLEGDWIGVTGSFDPSEMAGLLGSTAPPVDAATDAGGDSSLSDVISGLIDVETSSVSDAESTYRIVLELRDLLEASAGLGGDVVSDDELAQLVAPFPEQVEGVTRVVDGKVVEVVFDVAEAARAAGEDVVGSLVLRLELSDHDGPAHPPRPEDARTVSSEELVAGLGALIGLE